MTRRGPLTYPDRTEAQNSVIQKFWEQGNSAGRISMLMAKTGLRISKNAVIGLVHRREWVRLTNLSQTVKAPKPRPRPAPKPAVQPIGAEPIAIGPLNAFPDTNSCRYIAADVAAGDW